MPTDAILRIPEDELPGLLALARFDEQKFKALAAALAAAPMKLRIEEVTEAVLKLAQDLPRREVEQVVDVLSSLSVVRLMADVDVEVFVNDVIDAIEAQVEGFAANREEFEARLTEVFSYPSVLAPAKARSILFDHTNYLCRARIFSDIRPVFGSDVEQTPTTAMVTHTLKLSYHRGTGQIKDCFVVLDRKDLDELSRLIERAKAKEKTLHVTLAAAGIEPLLTD